MQTFLTRAIPSAKFPQQRFPRLWALMSEQRILRYFHLHCQTKSSEKSEKKKIKKKLHAKFSLLFWHAIERHFQPLHAKCYSPRRITYTPRRPTATC